MNRAAPDGQFPFAQGIKQAQLLPHGPRRELAPQGAFAFKNLFQFRVHQALGRQSKKF